MNKTIIALSLALAASTGAFTTAQAEDGFQLAPSNNSQPIFVAGVVTDLNGTKAAQGGVDYTATASFERTPMSEANRDFLYSH